MALSDSYWKMHILGNTAAYTDKVKQKWDDELRWSNLCKGVLSTLWRSYSHTLLPLAIGFAIIAAIAVLS